MQLINTQEFEQDHLITESRYPKNGPTNLKDIQIVGWDTEYTQLENQDPEVISHQLYLLGEEDNEDKEIFIDCIGDYDYTTVNTDRDIEIINLGRKPTIDKLIQIVQERSYKEEIYIVAHFNLAEFASTEGAREKIIGNTLCVVGNSFFGRFKEYPHVTFKDTYLIAQTSLKELGKSIGIEKIDNEYRDSGTMKDQYRSDIKRFIDYGMRDAEIAAKYFNQIMARAKDITEIEDIHKKSTAGSIGEIMLQRQLTNNPDRASRVGYKAKDKRNYDNNYVTRILQPNFPNEIQHVFKDTYYGGRNEAFCYGTVANDRIAYDYDINGAYGTAFGMLKEWDIKRLYTFKDFDNNPKKLFESLLYNPLSLGSVGLTFKFKDKVRMPGLPVRNSDNDTVYPKQGTTRITLQEYLTSFLHMKECQVHDVIMYKATDKYSLISEVINKLQVERNLCKTKGDKIGDTVNKLIVNSIYGKTAQGISTNSKTTTQWNKSYINPYTGRLVKKTTPMPQSKISNIAIASWITGMIRSIVAEYLFYIDGKYHNRENFIASVTTDGFNLVGIELNDMERQGVGTIGSLVTKHRELYFGDPDIITLKHNGKGLTSIKTRCYTMEQELENSELELLTALAGVSLRGRSQEEKIDFILEEFNTLEEGKHTKYTARKLQTANKWLEGNPFCEVIQEKSFNWDYDFKREPDMETAKDNDNGRIQFLTKPHKDIHAWEQAREDIKNFKRGKRRKAGGPQQTNKNKIIKLEDLKEFNQYRSNKKIAQSTEIMERTTDNLSLKIAAAILAIEKKFSQRELARRTGLPQKTISNMVKRIDKAEIDQMKDQVREEYEGIINSPKEQTA